MNSNETINETKKNYDDLKSRINEIALIYCKDYPKIESCGSYEQLGAIESTLQGTNDAAADLHEFIKFLTGKLNLPTECLLDEFDRKKNSICIVEFFDPKNIEHINAYNYYLINEHWQADFIKNNNIIFTKNWYHKLTEKIAKYYAKSITKK